MAGARLVPVVSPAAAREGDDAALLFDGKRLGPTGWDRVEFQLAANKGDEPRPLHKIASGGELSRIMLALKRILSRADQVATYVFDEVDAGIGGAVADVVGRQIRAVAEDKQVLCITHLPQIAAHAAVHFRVEKEERGGRVHTVRAQADGGRAQGRDRAHARRQGDAQGARPRRGAAQGRARSATFDTLNTSSNAWIQWKNWRRARRAW